MSREEQVKKILTKANISVEVAVMDCTKGKLKPSTDRFYGRIVSADVDKLAQQIDALYCHPIKPKIVCLCGSTRFSEAFQRAQLDETLAGKIVLSIGCNMKSDTELFRHLSPDELMRLKHKLDELHKRKIDLADEVKILNVGNYIGESTQSELSYAYAHNKPVRFLQPSKALDFNWNSKENRVWKDTKGGIN